MAACFGQCRRVRASTGFACLLQQATLSSTLRIRLLQHDYPYGHNYERPSSSCFRLAIVPFRWSTRSDNMLRFADFSKRIATSRTTRKVSPSDVARKQHFARAALSRVKDRQSDSPPRHECEHSYVTGFMQRSVGGALLRESSRGETTVHDPLKPTKTHRIANPIHENRAGADARMLSLVRNSPSDRKSLFDLNERDLS